MSTIKQRRIAKDYERAFRRGGSPAFCPVRSDYSRINPGGNRCNESIAQTIPSEGGDIIGWRCTRGHIFGRTPQEPQP